MPPRRPTQQTSTSHPHPLSDHNHQQPKHQRNQQQNDLKKSSKQQVPPAPQQQQKSIHGNLARVPHHQDGQRTDRCVVHDAKFATTNQGSSQQTQQQQQHTQQGVSNTCTLIIAQDKVAESIALSCFDLNVYGIFSFQGTPSDVRGQSTKKKKKKHQQESNAKSEVIRNLAAILGLDEKEEEGDDPSIPTAAAAATAVPNNLRYRHVLIMANRDAEGIHFTGLIISLFHFFWPELLDVPEFLQLFISPVVKVTKGDESLHFLSLPEFNSWVDSTGNNAKGYKIKFYKGLGSFTMTELKDYVVGIGSLEEPSSTHLRSFVVPFAQLSTADPEAADVFDLVFGKNDEDEDRRKQWIRTNTSTFLDYRQISETGGLKYSEFFNKEYKIVSNRSNERFIPHVMDGFKPTQRKVLFTCFKLNLFKDMEVEKLIHCVAEHSDGQQVEGSLPNTIIRMAQNFVGSYNNVNLLTSSGQFGTRLQGGKDAAPTCQIFTRLDPIARLIFHPDDDSLLTYRSTSTASDDGLVATFEEPEFYIPVIPMVLVNGAEGIATGVSSEIQKYNPCDIIDRIRRKLNGESIVDTSSPLTPFFRGFKGEIIPIEKKSENYKGLGKIERVDDTTLLITELPPKKCTHDYKQFLELGISGCGDKSFPEIEDFKENHSESTVEFTITATKEKLDSCENSKSGLIGKFRLSNQLVTTNMYLFDTNKQIVKYEKPEDILSEFFRVRLEFYAKRKVMLLQKLERDQRILANQARFVKEVCSGKLAVINRKRNEIIAELQERGYESFPNESKDKISEFIVSNSKSDVEKAQEKQTSGADLENGYAFLLGVEICSLTDEQAEMLQTQISVNAAKIKQLQDTTPEDLWRKDLDAIEVALNQRDNDDANVDNAAAQKLATATPAPTEAATKKRDCDLVDKPLDQNKKPRHSSCNE